MALIDKVKGFFSVLDTDDMNEVEEIEEVRGPEPTRPEPQVTERPRPVVQQQRPEVSIPKTQVRSESDRLRPIQQNTYQMDHSIQSRREEMVQTKTDTGRVVIALKYPKRYEDAQQVVDLLIENESVLIDFQYMADAQARRCIDFIDGASKVLFGGLQKVGNTMYLLTPANVVVNIEDLSIPSHGQDITYDYDMKRR